jgi:hypothetical protein
MKIEVTQEDIDKAVRGDPFCCPIALAVKRQSGKDVYVRSKWISLDSNDGCSREKIFLSLKAADFIYKFDHGIKVEPFIFEIE